MSELRNIFKMADIRLCAWLIAIATLSIIKVDGIALTPMNEETFKFTEAIYNATIPENSIGKTYVVPSQKMGMYITDPTLGIRYRITHGDSSEFFKTEVEVVGDFSFLKIRTKTSNHEVLNRERQELYRLRIKAIAKYKNSPTLEAQTEVIIHITDTNDMSPLFYPISYSARVHEDHPLHRSIIQVSASDADVGVNGEVYYSFLQKTDTFAIHPMSGIVSLTRQLVYTKNDFYELDVLAEDRGAKLGSSSSQSTAKVRISVVQVNFHAPDIQVSSFPSVIEHSAPGKLYAVLLVTDKDNGVNGEIGQVSIIDGNNGGDFTIVEAPEANSYHIKVSQSIDRELTPMGYNLTVQATDKGKPPKSTTKMIHVSVQDKNDHPPKLQKMYELDIDEIVPVQTPLIFLNASDTDLGKNAEVRYKIVGGNDNGWFNIGHKTGLITVANPLDAETSNVVELVVEVADQGITRSRKVTRTTLRINIQDYNDNSPVFNMTGSKVYVMENQPIGTVVTTVNAYDVDSGENGYISYSIANMNPVPFEIDHFSGDIKTTEVLDFESMRREYKLKIRASDWGSPFRRESETILKIQLKDVNDNRPRFQQHGCRGYLSREALLGTELITISAIDFDIGNLISYRILSGNDDNCFTLDESTGVVKMKCNLMSGKGVDTTASTRSIKLTASDGVNDAEPLFINITLVNNNRNKMLSNNDASITCKATNVLEQMQELLQKAAANNADSNQDVVSHIPNEYLENLNPPEFEISNPVEVQISESLLPGTVVATISATDPDPGYNGKLVYVITDGNKGAGFRMDTYTGELVILSGLDRETKDSYKLEIKVYDLGVPSKSATTSLTINIDDANDNAPVFENQEYQKTLSENVAIGMSIVKVFATDADQGKNAGIIYDIITDTDDFSIGSKTGVIKVSQKLDRELQEEYKLEVIAKDLGDQPLTSTVVVSIKLEDINDNAPEFKPSSYHVRIREDLPVGSIVLTVSAHDSDLEAGGLVRYSLQDGMDNKFTVDKFTGTVRIANRLDYESKQVYNITARARDRGNPPLSSKCHVIIEIIDVNENLYVPRFNNFVISGTIREDASVGTSIMRVSATDYDDRNSNASADDYKITYSIQDGTGLGRFSIDPDEGIIRTSDILDRESAARYWLTVYATDRGTVPLYSSIEVLIEVQDINDNVPQTFKPIYFSSIPENSVPDLSVVRVTALDIDHGSSNKLTYEITSGNPQTFFKINEFNGLITTTKRKLDRENQKEHILEITVSDNGTPSMSSSARVVITINDTNDNSPIFLDKTLRINVLAMPKPEEEVELYRVVAKDKDVGPNADIDYSIKKSKGNNRFKIHPKTGVITTSRELEANNEYEIAIKATDNGRPQKRSSSRVIMTVVARPEESPMLPQFVNPNQRNKMMENDDIGAMVCIMSAKDEDSDKLWYSITGGNDEFAFTIDIETGNIRLARALDWERTPEYNLTISVTDGVNTVYTWLYVEVLDINDNRPTFKQQVYSVEISENTTPGTSVIQVTADDADKDKRLFYTFHSAMHGDSMRKFKIDQHTGVITTTAKLDREAIARHDITIMVRDQGTLAKRSLSRVQITITDHNDHAPKFMSEIFEGRVFETAAIGSRVVQLLAIDKDKGKNAEIKYSLLSGDVVSRGNVAGAFDIDEKLGVVMVARQLDRDSQSEYNLVAMATDGGSPPLSSTVSIKVYVTISNNAPPKFEKDEYTTELAENQDIGTYVTVVQAVSRSSVMYTIVNGNALGYYMINPSAGVITTKKELDYEQHRFYNLTIQATNMVGLKVNTTVLIHIIDENDNAPIFYQQEYVGIISESSQSGSVVLDDTKAPLVIKANDRDDNQNKLLDYSIQEPAARHVFSIDSTTGAIRTLTKLDHETVPEYSFTVQVVDLGKPSLTSEVPAKVTIHIDDVNDSPPKFKQDIYEATVYLPTFTDISVLHIEASDPDTDINSQLIYSIKSGNINNTFKIDPESGYITVRHVVNIAESYRLTVQVTDGVYDASCDARITVRHTDDSGLGFKEDVYEVEIMENKTDVMTVVMVQPVGHTLNEHLKFRILNPDPMFQIGETSGVVRTTGEAFDRELKDRYTIIVEVRDERDPPRIAHVEIRVTVADMNDNIPIFVNQPYYAVVSIDAQMGDVVKRVSAIDRDIGPNSELVYSITDGAQGKFNIDPVSGEIAVMTSLESDDQNKEYALQVQAQDKGTPPLHVRVIVPVKIMNKATPVFEAPFYSVDIPENIKLHSAIINIEATSPNGRKLIYSITDGDIYDEFAVDFSMDMNVLDGCVLTVIEELDYESRHSYELIMRATDTLTGSYSEVTVHINLLDINDKTPSFSSVSYTATVSEATTIGTSILTLSASDDDSGLNKKVYYDFMPIEEDRYDLDFFSVDRNTGVISTSQLLDHEKHQKLQFIAVVTDMGSPALSSTAPITVIVTDLNDNSPKFDQPSYEVTITDQVKRGQFITVVSASDEDSSNQGELTYSIVAGNMKQTFAIESETGLIRLSTLRTPDLMESLYTLNVSVTDSVFTNFARVTINVKPSNKHVPQFRQSVYKVAPKEDIPIGKLITKVTADDGDNGKYGEVTYAIKSDDAEDMFRIDALTGEIFSLEALDHETRGMYSIPIAATDFGGQVGFTIVQVEIQDVDDNRPVFLAKEYKTNVYSDVDLGYSVLQVEGRDKDVGDNGHLIYSFLTVEESPYFSIDNRSGIISVARSLNQSVGEQFQLFVRVADKSDPELDNRVPVEILVLGEEDYPPVFKHQEYSYFIQENDEIGSVIATIEAESNDTLTYSIIPGSTKDTNYPQRFSIDDKGEIKILAGLDYEECSLYKLRIQAQSGTNPAVVAHAVARVHLMDVNDSPPMFESVTYDVNMAENTKVGSKVIQVIAHDKDSGSNAEISYSFSPDIGNLANIFSIDSETGWISTLVELDREKVQSYELTIVAIDHGAERLSGTTLVYIDITDVNDEPPIFSKDLYQGTINEDALPGTIILEVSTTDLDLEPNAKVNYYISGGDPLGQFAVGKSGEIYVNKALDREATSKYELTTTATDGAFVSDVMVVVEVLDANDNAPVCTLPMEQIIIPENLPLNSFIARITASDADESDTINTRIYYDITGEGSEKLNMHKESGIITIADTLDRETIPEFHLLVTAIDGGGLSCETELFITLSDVNDNPPIFSMPEYSVDIFENAEVNTLLTRVSATDQDLGINRKVRFSLEKQDYFEIDSQSGIIRLVKPLDRETQAEYNLTLKAFDQGTPQMYSTAQLVVILLDINDNPPQFERNVYEVEVSENKRIGTSFSRVYATSKDTGVNAEITYLVVAGNELGNFRVDSKTGDLSVVQPLDYEDFRQYHLSVKAVDGGTPPLSNTANVKINVTDYNDEKPIFGQDVYSVTLREDVELESQVLQVQAADADSAPNAKITYEIVAGDAGNQFTIDPEDGKLTIASPLDRETIDSYRLEVMASDSGTPTQSSSCIIEVKVTDANDCPPEFTSANYSAVVQEDKSIDFSIIKIEVTDCDLDPNAGPFSYDIIGGNKHNKFKVNNNGVLSTAGKFNRKIQDMYVLTVRVFDNGAKPMYANTYVEISIIEESAFPPVVTPLAMSISSYMDEFPGGTIGRVKATDPDMYDILTYDIVSQNKHLFDIEFTTGIITAYPDLDAGEYTLNVSVSDRKFTVYSTVKLTVDMVSEEMVSNAVILRFENLLPEEFVTSYRSTILRAIRSQLKNKIKDIYILSIQPAPAGSARRKRSESDLDILLAAKRSNGLYFKRNALRRKLIQSKPELERAMHLKIKKIVNDVCPKDFCDNGDCKSVVEFHNDQDPYVIYSDTESYVSIRHSLKPNCECNDGYGGERCSDKVDECSRNPCPNYKICQPIRGRGFECICPEGKKGPMCDRDKGDIENCVTIECRRGAKKPLTFKGQSYARWRLIEPIDRRLSLSLDMRTVDHQATVMHASGRFDYSILEVTDGYIQYRFECGSGEGLVRVSEMYINDGQWHSISVERHGNNAEILVDGKFQAEGSAPGNNDVLNLHSHDVYFGAEVENLAHGYTDVRKGYHGCLREIKINNVKLPYVGSSEVGALQKFEEVEFHCKDNYDPGSVEGVCGKRPCLNGGSCQVLSGTSYQCHCRGRFHGARCEIDTNPCASSPCMNNGVCMNKVNDFECKCKGRFEGKRCDYGFYCKPNPCKNGGMCEEGPTKHICNCKGFQGDFCEHDINECLESPCQNDATCHNTHGSFKCNCTKSTKGDLCETYIDFASITSTQFGINPEEIYGIVGVGVGLLLIVIIIVLVVRWRRRKHRNNGDVAHNSPGGVILNSTKDEAKRQQKQNNIDMGMYQQVPPSPRPPPVPNRPVSYTPSIHGDSMNTLNNFDLARNYGSAADDLETLPTVPIYIPEFLQNLNVQKQIASMAAPGSQDGSEHGSLNKPNWEYDYSANLQTFQPEDGMKKVNNLEKDIPVDTDTEQMQMLAASNDDIHTACSLSSLPVSESEDDQMGYHWDTSDWAPNAALPNITEVPTHEILDSPSASVHSQHSNESNTHIGNEDVEPTERDRLMSNLTDEYPDSEFIDSEYVGDSEYADNEDMEGEGEMEYPDVPNFQEILAMQAELNYYDDEDLPQDYNRHRNHYLPNHDLDNSQNGNGSVNGEAGAAANNVPKNGEIAQIEDDDDSNVIQYGFPQAGKPHRFPQDDTDYDHSAISGLEDNMSVSIGGYDSESQISASEISNLCEIEDSEMNLSDYESGDDTLRSRINGHLHTQV
ncbi:unnamed protein product [Owenia fusiformis]|uniref:Uncharacterized protein n=1 Tax=Owenia fusiformis TaxID=6347 RepID=A0A8J1TG17_OWEFU|nr:unnamed protein product [Owenia fusiformis]